MNNYTYDNGMKEAIDQIYKERKEIVEQFKLKLKNLDIEYHYLKLEKNKNTLNIFLDNNFLKLANTLERNKKYIITTDHNPLDLNPCFLMSYQTGWLMFDIQFECITILDNSFKLQYQIKKRPYKIQESKYNIYIEHGIVSTEDKKNIKLEIDKEMYCFVENNSDKTLYLEYSGFNKITEINFGDNEITCHIKNSSIEKIVFDRDENFKSLTIGRKYVKNYELPFKTYQSFDKYINDMKEHQIVYQLMTDKGFKYMTEKDFDNIKKLLNRCTQLDFNKIKETEKINQNVIDYFHKSSLELFDISGIKRNRIYTHFVERDELEYFFRKIQKINDLVSIIGDVIPLKLEESILKINKESNEIYKDFNKNGKNLFEYK